MGYDDMRCHRAPQQGNLIQFFFIGLDADCNPRVRVIRPASWPPGPWLIRIRVLFTPPRGENESLITPAFNSPDGVP